MNRIMFPLILGCAGLIVYLTASLIRRRVPDLKEAIKVMLSTAGVFGAIRLGSWAFVGVPAPSDIVATDLVYIAIGAIAVAWVSIQTSASLIRAAFRKPDETCAGTIEKEGSTGSHSSDG